MKTEKEIILCEIQNQLSELIFYGEQEAVRSIQEILYPIMDAERSKREDYINPERTRWGKAIFEASESIIEDTLDKCRCGALNSQETD